MPCGQLASASQMTGQSHPLSVISSFHGTHITSYVTHLGGPCDVIVGDHHGFRRTGGAWCVDQSGAIATPNGGHSWLQRGVSHTSAEVHEVRPKIYGERTLGNKRLIQRMKEKDQTSWDSGKMISGFDRVLIRYIVSGNLSLDQLSTVLTENKDAKVD